MAPNDSQQQTPDTGKPRTFAEMQAERRAKEAAEADRRLHESSTSGPGKKFTAQEVAAKEKETRGRISQAVDAFDPAKLTESMQRYAQFGNVLAQQDSQFRRELGSKPTAPDEATAHSEGYLMRSQANLADNVYLKTMAYLKGHPGDADKLVPALNGIWKQIGNLEPGILYHGGFQDAVAQNTPSGITGLDKSKPPLVRAPEVTVLSSSPPVQPAELGIKSAQATKPEGNPFAGVQVEKTNPFLQLPPGAAKAIAEQPDTQAAPPLKTITQSEWKLYSDDRDRLEKKLWGPYAQNKDKYDQVLGSVANFATTAMQQFNNDNQFYMAFKNAADNKERTQLLNDPKYNLKGTATEAAAQDLLKYGAQTSDVMSWAADNALLKRSKAPVTSIAALEADSKEAEAGYNKGNKAQVDAALKKELDATDAAINSRDSKAAVEHMRNANAIITKMAAPAVDRRWLGEEYRYQANKIDPSAEKDPTKSKFLMQQKNDMSLHAEQQYTAAVDHSSILNQELLKRASDQLATMMQRTVVGNQGLTDEFSAMQARISGVGTDRSESMTDMTYQNTKRLALLQTESNHFEEAKTALAQAIKVKGWTVQDATNKDPDYAMLANGIARGLPENEKGQIAYQEHLSRTAKIELWGAAAYATVATALHFGGSGTVLDEFLPKMGLSSTAALAAGITANYTMGGEHDTLGNAAFNSLIAPVAIHSAMGVGKGLAEGFNPELGEKMLGAGLTKEKLITRLAQDIGSDNKLTTGQLYDYVAGKQINPETVGLHKPTNEAELKAWKEALVYDHGHILNPELFAGSNAQLNQVATQIFSRGPAWKQVIQRIGTAIHQEVPSDVKTKAEFLTWAGQHDAPNAVKYAKALEDVGSTEVIFRQGKLVENLNRALPKPDMTKKEVIDWLRSTGRDAKADEIKNWRLGDNEPFMAKGVPVPGVRPNLLGFGAETTSAEEMIGNSALPKAKALNLKEVNGALTVTKAGTKVTASELRNYFVSKSINPDEVMPGLTKAAQDTPEQLVYDRGWKIPAPTSSNRAAQALSDLQPIKPGLTARTVHNFTGAVPSIARSVSNTVRSAAGTRAIDVVNDAPEVLANALKFRATAAAPLIGQYSAFAETPVLQRISKEVSGTPRLPDSDLTLGQLKGGAARNRIGAKQLLRQDLVDDAGKPLTDDTYLIKDGKRQQFYIKGANGQPPQPLKETDNILQTTNVQNASLLKDFISKRDTEAKIFNKLATQKGGDTYTLGNYKEDLRRLNIAPESLPKSDVLNKLPDDTPLVVKGKLQKVATFEGVKYDLSQGFGLNETQRNVVAGSTRPIENTPVLWMKGDTKRNKVLSTFLPRMDFLGVSGNPLYPEMAGVPGGIKQGITGGLSNFNVLNSPEALIKSKIGLAQATSYIPAFAIAGPGKDFVSTAYNSQYDQFGRPMSTGDRLSAGWRAATPPDYFAATATTTDKSKESDVLQAFWDSQDPDHQKWMQNFEDKAALIYSGQGNVKVNIVADDTTAGKLKFVGHIGDQQVFSVDKTRDRSDYFPTADGALAWSMYGINTLWGLAALEQEKVLSPFKSSLLNAARPAWWLTGLSSDLKDQLYPRPSGTQSVRSGFQDFRNTETDYLKLKSGRRPFGVPLPLDTPLNTTQPNDPGPQAQGTAKQIEGPN